MSKKNEKTSKLNAAKICAAVVAASTIFASIGQDIKELARTKTSEQREVVSTTDESDATKNYTIMIFMGNSLDKDYGASEEEMEQLREELNDFDFTDKKIKIWIEE